MISRALDSRISRARIVTRPSNPAGAGAAETAPGALAAATLGVAAVEAGSGYGGDSVIQAYGSTVQRDADDASEIVLFGAFLRIACDIHLALWRAVAGQARGSIILRDHDPVSRPVLGVGHFRIRLAPRPGRIEEFGLDDPVLEAVGTRLAVAHQLGRGGHLQPPFPLG